tara:strand:+ start:1267 stop:1437 length:171 start_codon:yes stop_codon:yes gene_type:complete
MADLNDVYKFVKEDEFKSALKDLINYCKHDTCTNLVQSVEKVEEYLQGKEIKKEKL